MKTLFGLLGYLCLALYGIKIATNPQWLIDKNSFSKYLMKRQEKFILLFHQVLGATIAAAATAVIVFIIFAAVTDY